MALTRRAEIRFSEEEYEALRLEAERRGVSFGGLVRDTLRHRFLIPAVEQRRETIRRPTEPGLDLGWDETKSPWTGTRTRSG